MKKLLLGLLFTGLFAYQLCSCNDGDGGECRGWKDVDNDGLCDLCDGTKAQHEDDADINKHVNCTDCNKDSVITAKK